jgi:hypothetical protein
MPRIDASRTALALSAGALFISLGGTALAVSQIGTNQIKNGAVTTKKLRNGAVTRSKLAGGAVGTSQLANNAVTSSKVRDGSLKASDIAANTFLASDGTAANSLQLGGLPAGQYMQGRGSQVFRRVQLAAGSAPFAFLSLGFGTIEGTCAPGGVPKIRFVSNTTTVNLIDWVTDFGAPHGTTDVTTTNGLTNGAFFEVPHTTVVPQEVTWQAAYNDGVQDHVATAWTTGQDIGTTSCIFIGQAVTTG